MDERLIQLLCNTIIFVALGVYSIYQGKLAKQGGRTIYYFSDKVTLWFHRNASDEEIEKLKINLSAPERLERQGRNSIIAGVIFISFFVLAWAWIIIDKFIK